MLNARDLRLTAVGIGVLFWISDLVTLVGGLITGTVPSAAGALTGMYPHATQLVAGTLIAHVNDFAIVGYGVLLYPVLASYSPGAALGFATFKVVEAVLLVVAAVTFLSLISLSQAYLSTGGADMAPFKAAADMALTQQFWAGRLAAFAYLVSTPVLNLVLFRTRVVPRWLSGFGLAACAMLATGLALGVSDPTHGFQPSQVLVIPIILWELTFATWLIAKGFDVARAREAPALAA